MCGIIGYIGNKKALPIIINGLKKLEYRGYDSAGIALLNGNMEIYKKRGKVSDLEKFVVSKNTAGNTGIGHTRWATHGEPTDTNAHPHTSMHGHFSLVHNGIIENCARLKTELTNHGYHFRSETDTEVLVNLIEYFYNKGNGITAEDAIQRALSGIKGSYGIAVLCACEKDKIIAARNSSPIVAGLGNGEHFVASDISPLALVTNHVVYLEDHDLAIITKNSFTLKKIKSNAMKITVSNIDIESCKAEKDNFKHFMLKEIYEQPETIEITLKEYLKEEEHVNMQSKIFSHFQSNASAARVLIIGCGTSWHAKK
jgi:glutamine---fructose-6-phosphate transaminase (isomerizing)